MQNFTFKDKLDEMEVTVDGQGVSFWIDNPDPHGDHYEDRNAGFQMNWQQMIKLYKMIEKQMAEDL